MKTSIHIEDGKSSIVLRPESDFEKDLLEKVCNNGYDASIRVLPDYTMFSNEDHRIVIDLNENK